MENVAKISEIRFACGCHRVDETYAFCKNPNHKEWSCGCKTFGDNVPGGNISRCKFHASRLIIALVLIVGIPFLGLLYL